MTKQELRDLFEYDEWATVKVLQVVAGVPAEEYRKDLKSSHGGIHGTLVHTYGADEIWLARWTGQRPVSLPSAADISSLGALQEKWSDYRRRVEKFLDSLDEPELNSLLTYRDLKGNEYTQTLFRLMLHKVNHSTFHRGQVVAMLRQVGVKPPTTDLSAFFREKNL